MKKNLFLLTVALGTVLFISSCQKDAPVVPMTPESAVTYNLGCNLLPTDVYASLPVAAELNTKTSSKPTSVYLNVPPIGNQGGGGSAIAWGTAYAGRSISYQNTYGGAYSTSVNIFSPSFVYYLIPDLAYTTEALDLLVDTGVCVWSLYEGGEISKIAWENAAAHKISSYATVAINVDAMKTQLAAGKVIVVAGNVYYEYMYLGYNQVITSASGSSYGGHCYACVGYDDAKQAFRFMNSWGTSWATDGFGWMGYNAISSYWNEAYVLYE